MSKPSWAQAHTSLFVWDYIKNGQKNGSLTRKARKPEPRFTPLPRDKKSHNCEGSTKVERSNGNAISIHVQVGWKMFAILQNTKEG